MTADKPKHTPGEWKLCRHLESIEADKSCPCGYRGGIWGPDEGHIICEMGSTTTNGQEGLEPERYERSVEIANAHLIAAAPDLLAQLKSVLACIEAAGECLGNMDAMRAAIAKAEGRI